LRGNFFLNKKELYLNVRNSLNFIFMIQEIIKNLSPDLTTDLVKSFNLTSDQASKTISTTKNSLVGSLTKEASTGNFDGVLGMK
jgi:hypothetical protein